MEKTQINDKYFIIPIIFLSLYFIFRLLNQSDMVYIFPIDNNGNDYSSHMARIFFLDEYGYKNQVPNWYNGNYRILQFYSPLWYFFTLPFYHLTNNVQVAVVISLWVIYLLSFLSVYLLGIILKLSKIKRIFLFLAFYANPIAIGYFLRLGKIPELFGWLFVINMLSLLFYYKDKKLDLKFSLMFIILLTLLFYTHLLLFIVSSIFILSFLIYVSGTKNKLNIIISSIITLIITSPFWIDLLKNALGKAGVDFVALKRLITTGWLHDQISAFITPTIFIIIFFIYSRNNETKQDKKLYLVPLILAFLYITRILVFIPIFNMPESNTYDFMFILLSTILFLKLKLDEGNLKKFINLFLIIIPILSIIISLLFTPLFKPHMQDTNDLISLMKEAKGKLYFVNIKTVNQNSIYAYGAIYYNTSTPGGWDPSNLTKEYENALNLPMKSLENKDCKTFKESLDYLKTEYVITPINECSFLESCNLDRKLNKNNYCLLKYENQP